MWRLFCSPLLLSKLMLLKLIFAIYWKLNWETQGSIIIKRNQGSWERLTTYHNIYWAQLITWPAFLKDLCKANKATAIQIGSVGQVQQAKILSPELFYMTLFHRKDPKHGLHARAVEMGINSCRQASCKHSGPVPCQGTTSTLNCTWKPNWASAIHKAVLYGCTVVHPKWHMD